MTTRRPRLLLVDDDETFVRILGRVLERKGFDVIHAADEPSVAPILDDPPDYAVIDLRLGESGSGLRLIPRLRAASERMTIMVLTGYASLATAVDAVKLGADQYLAKPVDAETLIEALFARRPDPDRPLRDRPLSVKRLEWEHIQRVLAEHDGNVSAAARALGMHRRTLQRKLAKHAVRE